MTNDFRTKKQLEILRAYIYKGITGLTFLNVEIYDKISKKMFIGNIEKSSWTLEEVKKRNKEKKWKLNFK